ncbi:MAG: M1 family aminopeptidase [Bacteroidales bacterium]
MKLRELSIGFLFWMTILPLFAQQNVPKQHFHACANKHMHSEKRNLKQLFSSMAMPEELKHYDVKFIFLDIEVTPLSTEVKGKVTYKAEVVSEEFKKYSFQLIPEIEIKGIKINNQSAEFSRKENQVFVDVNGLNKGDLFTAEITYHRQGAAASNSFFQGIQHKNSKKGTPVTYTLSEPLSAIEWFPVKQDLTDKADSTYIYLTCDKKYKAGSQGLLVNTTEIEGDKLRYEWVSHYPIAYYLISFTVSDYQEYSFYAKPEGIENEQGLLIQNYIYDEPGALQDLKDDINETKGMIEVFSELYSLYPFYKEKYGHTLAPMGGSAMEHQTMSTMGTFRPDIIAHELGHQWFGDYVTCESWSHIWINEGFASYSEYLYFEKINKSEDAIKKWLNEALYYAKYSPYLSVYVPENDVYIGNEARIFNYGSTYRKGALVLHMLRNEINDDQVFFNILKTYVNEFKNSVATAEDFFAVVKNVSGKDFQYFLDQWYYGKGYPGYNVKWWYDDDKKEITISLKQSPYYESTPFFRMTNEVKVIFEDGDSQILRMEQTENIQDFVFPIDKKVISIEFDPELKNLQEIYSLKLGLPEYENTPHFMLSPNPADNYCQVILNSSVESGIVNVYSELGDKVHSDFFKGNRVNINTGELSKGVYIVEIILEGIGKREKLVVR